MIATLAALALLAAHCRAAEDAIVGIRGAAPKLLVLYHRKALAVTLPKGVELGTDAENHKAFIRAGKVVDPATLPLRRKLTFTKPITVYPIEGDGNVLVCTDPRVEKTGKGDYDDFCGVISIEGRVLFKFPVVQHRPKTMLRPLGMTADGRHAEVVVGEEVSGETGVLVDKPREILAWTAPNRFKRLAGPWKNGTPKDPDSVWPELQRDFIRRADAATSSRI